ncbi:MAG TPA: hypothetical protein VM283_05270 [Armatimonadota bacterium]|nr:hypothetical protein [Armatimonadota bacterium]
MKARIAVALAVCAVALGSLVSAAADGREFVDYPEFRYVSALPGGGWGVTPDGRPGFEGAIQTNIPVAYTPCTGVILGYASGSFDSTPRIEFSGNNVNGTATVAFGLGSPGHGIYFCEMGTSNHWEPAQNLQVQLVPASEDRPALAIGVQDMFRNRDERVGDRGNGADSYYAVVTQQFGPPEHPFFASAGVGSKRFNGIFGGVSWRAADQVTLMAEYDGWNINAGAAFDLSEWLTDDIILFASMVDLDRTVIGLTWVYNYED